MVVGRFELVFRQQLVFWELRRLELVVGLQLELGRVFGWRRLFGRRRCIGELVMRSRAISPDDHARIAEAVRSAETRTSGEIYCVLAHASARYFFPAAFMVTLGVVIVSLAVVWLLDRWWYQLNSVDIVAAQLVAIACALAILAFFPAIRIHFVPMRQRYRQAHDNAVRQFLGRNIHITTRRTGVLLFVSL